MGVVYQHGSSHISGGAKGGTTESDVTGRERCAHAQPEVGDFSRGSFGRVGCAPAQPEVTQYPIKRHP